MVGGSRVFRPGLANRPPARARSPAPSLESPGRAVSAKVQYLAAKTREEWRPAVEGKDMTPATSAVDNAARSLRISILCLGLVVAFMIIDAQSSRMSENIGLSIHSAIKAAERCYGVTRLQSCLRINGAFKPNRPRLVKARNPGPRAASFRFFKRSNPHAHHNAEIEAKFWKALEVRHDPNAGSGRGADEAHAQPMTAQLEREGRGPIWFFTSKETDLVAALGRRHEASAQFASKGHDLFASIDGTLSIDEDRATIDRLWNPFVAAWFKEGRNDPKLQLLRLDPTGAQIWLNEHSVFAGIKLLLGSDPKDDYKGKTAEVRLS